MLATALQPLLEVKMVTGGVGLLARFLLPLIGLLLLARLAPGRARTLAQAGLAVLMANAMLPRALNAAVGWAQLMSDRLADPYVWTYASIRLLEDALYVLGVALLLQALRRALPHKPSAPR